MHPDLEQIAVLGEIDAELRRLDREIDRAEHNQRQAAQAVVAAEAEVTKAQRALAENRQLQHDLQRRIDKLQNRKKSANRVLEGIGGGDPEAAQRQLEQCEELLDEAETELLELLETEDTLQQALDTCKSVLSERTRHRDQIDVDVPALLGKLRQEHAETSQRRATTEGGLPSDLQRRYATLLKRRGTAVSPVKDGACKACNRVAPQQQLADLKRGMIELCRNCGRFLVLPAEQATATS